MGCTLVQVSIFALMVVLTTATCPAMTNYRFTILNEQKYCTDLTQSRCSLANVESIRCRWWNGRCEYAGIDFYLTVNKDEVKYGQLPRRIGLGNLPYSPVDYAADPAVGFYIEDSPSIGSMVPVWSQTEVLNPQPALIQLDGSFAYKYTSAPGDDFPKTTEITYTYREPCDQVKFFGKIIVTIWDGTSLANARAKYHCKINTPCLPEAAAGANRPFVVQQVLPRIWGHIQEYTQDQPPRPCFAKPEESAKFRFEDNSVVIDGYGRQGWGGQRVFGFNALKSQMSLWDASKIDPTASFDRTCVANVAGAMYTAWNNDNSGNKEHMGVWGSVFNPVTYSRWAANVFESNYCPLVNHIHLCENAPLLTVRQGFIKNFDGSDSEYAEPWIMSIEDCQTHVTGIFSWDLMRRLTRSWEISSTYLTPQPNEYKSPNPNWQIVPIFNFNFPQPGVPSDIPSSNIVITFDFYNMAIQPYSLLDITRSFVDINDKYEVQVNVRECLKFDFESGTDTFTVDFQWFRYKSYCKINSGDQYKPFGLGLNLIVYPEAYDAAYSADTPKIQSVYGVQKKYFNTVPRKIIGVDVYSTRNPTTGAIIAPKDEIGRPHATNGDILWFDDQCGWDGNNNAYGVKSCAAEPNTGSSPADSCDWQNITVRFVRPNPDDDATKNGIWTEELVLEFLLMDGQRPTLRLKPGLLQTAVDATGAFSGCTGLCRTVPSILEEDRSTAVTGVPGYLWSSNQYCNTFSKDVYTGADWKSACGWDARSGDAKGCMIEQTHDSVTQPTKCVPAVSISCEEPDAITYGPDDRVIFVYDIYNIEPRFVEPVSVRIEWSASASFWNNAAAAEHKVWVFHEGGQAKVATLNNGDWFSPAYNWLNATILTQNDRELQPLSSAINNFRKWDFGFAFNPGLLNENMKIRVYTQLRVLVNPRDTSVPYRQPSAHKSARRFQKENVDELDCFVPQPAGQVVPTVAPQRKMRALEENSRGTLDYSEEITFDPKLSSSGRRAVSQTTDSQNGQIKSKISLDNVVVKNNQDAPNMDNAPAPWVLSGIILGVTVGLVGISVLVVIRLVKKRNGAFPVASGQSFSDAITK